MGLAMAMETGVRGQEGPSFSLGEPRGTITQPEINEASGLVASVANLGSFWTHNDSGDAARIFLLNDRAQLRATYYLSGVEARDWEDIGTMTRAGRNFLLIGDMGDNGARYPSVRIHVVEEPVVTSDTPSVDTLPAAGIHTFVLTYDKGPRDAESLFFDPIDQYLYVISKRELQVGVYRTALPELEPTGGTQADTLVLRQVGTIPYTFMTAADISRDGTELLVKNLTNVFYWRRDPGESVAGALRKPAIRLPYKPEPQGEAITFSPDGQGYYTVSEAALGMDAILYFYQRQGSITEIKTK